MSIVICPHCGSPPPSLSGCMAKDCPHEAIIDLLCKPARPAHWNSSISDASNAAYDTWLDLGQELHLIDQKRAELVERQRAAHREIVRLGRIEGWHA